MNVNKLRGKIVERGLNIEKLSEIINIDKSTLYRKMNNLEKVTVGEAIRIKAALDMTNEEAHEIFFG